jgi:hypothetical protein
MNILTAGVSKGGGITSNYPQVKQALQDYVAVRNQSVFDSVKEKMANIAFKAAQNTQFTGRADIRTNLSTLPITKDGGRVRRGDTKWVGLYKLINWQRKNSGLNPLGGSKKRKLRGVYRRVVKKDKDGQVISIDYKQKMVKQVPRNTGPSAGVSRFMDRKTRGFIQYRAKGSKFLRIGWAVAAAALGKPFGKGDFGPATLARLSGKAYGGGATIEKLAPGSNRFTIYNGAGVFDVRYKGTPMRSSKDIARARAIQKAGLMRGLQAEIKSMYQLVIQRNSQDWFGKKVKVKAV